MFDGTHVTLQTFPTVWNMYKFISLVSGRAFEENSRYFSVVEKNSKAKSRTSSNSFIHLFCQLTDNFLLPPNS